MLGRLAVAVVVLAMSSGSVHAQYTVSVSAVITEQVTVGPHHVEVTMAAGALHVQAAAPVATSGTRLLETSWLTGPDVGAGALGPVWRRSGDTFRLDAATLDAAAVPLDAAAADGVPTRLRYRSDAVGITGMSVGAVEAGVVVTRVIASNS